MNRLFIKFLLISLVTFAVIGCSKDKLEDIVTEEPGGEDEDGGGEVTTPIYENLADVNPLIGTYKGAISAFEGGINTNVPNNYYLSVTKVSEGIIRVKGNGISYYKIVLVKDGTGVKPHESMTFVKSFSYNPISKMLSFTIEKPYVFVNYQGTFYF